MSEKKVDGRNGGTAQAPLSDQVYRHIKSWISEGEYHPGERIREAAICDRLSVSRTPVREAIRRLQAENLIEIEAQRGAIVAELGAQQVVDLYTVRQEMEGFAARLAAQHASQPEIDLMRDILLQSKSINQDARSLNDNNWRLHRAILIAAHNPFLVQAMDSLAGSLAFLRGAKYIPEDRPQHLYDEHARVIRAIEDRDPAEADAAMQDHIKSAFKIHLGLSLSRAKP